MKNIILLFIGQFLYCMTFAQEGNTFYGEYAGKDITTGYYNTGIGYSSLKNLETGYYNCGLGSYSGYYLTSGYNNVFIGYQAAMNFSTGNDNVLVGFTSGELNKGGSYNCFMGSRSGQKNTTGNYNVFLGCAAGRCNTTATENTFVGNEAGYSISTGIKNSFLGCNAGHSNVEGNYNTFLGFDAGHNNLGSGNVLLGYQAGYGETESNRLYISNSGTTTPLIYGEFDNKNIQINGNLGIGVAPSKGALHIKGSVHVENDNGQIFHISASKDLVFIGNKAYNAWLKVQDSEDTLNYGSQNSLWVSGGIVSENYAIADVSSWSDYVFDDNYQLTSLTKLKAYIKENRHLPDFPSANEIEKFGYKLHDINKSLLKSIEELTLHTINQQELIDKQNLKIDEQSKQIRVLEQQMKLYQELAEEVNMLKSLLTK